MATSVVYDDAGDDTPRNGQLFADKKFWLAQRVPTRHTYKNLIESNGGTVVMLEKQADYLIADHLHKKAPPGTISYEFIDASIKKGEIVEPDNHPAGPPLGHVRQPGSISQPARTGRNAYTADEDKILYKWVSDCAARGGSLSGNEIYQQLEAKYPRHTWQSWRDRYLKKLQHRPPTAFNIPNNTPPSPPSDQPTKPRPPSGSGPGRVANKAKSIASEDYTIDDFDALFTTEDWEELYANVDHITSVGVAEYVSGWTHWAEAKALEGKTQSAEQWRQYFERVVRPQWVQDPASKKEEIKKRFGERHDASQRSREASEAESNLNGVEVEPSPSKQVKEPDAEHLGGANPLYSKSRSEQRPGSKELPVPDDQVVEKFLKTRRGRPASEAYVFYMREQKAAILKEHPDISYIEINEITQAEWKALSDKGKQPYLAMEAADKRRHEIERSQAPLEVQPSSTVRHQAPNYITEAKERALKRIRGGDNADEGSDQNSPTPPSKKRKQKEPSPDPEPSATQGKVLGTQQLPLEISSRESSSIASQEEMETQRQGQEMDDIIPPAMPSKHIQLYTDIDAESNVSDILDLGALPSATEDLGPPSSSNYPSNTPTPRAPRHTSKFDTQAILSSPSQGLNLGKLPRPPGFTQRQETLEDSLDPQLPSSPAQHPPSEASTTHSMQEFRRSLNSIQDAPDLSTIAPLPRPEFSSSAASPTSALSDDVDPDPPLEPHEIKEFYAEMTQAGFARGEIAAALLHTMCRPELTATVLDAWKEDKPLPNERGIWSEEDDDDVESGDGVALAQLERKHTCDGWGGISERLGFLEKKRSRGF